MKASDWFSLSKPQVTVPIRGKPWVWGKKEVGGEEWKTPPVLIIFQIFIQSKSPVGVGYLGVIGDLFLLNFHLHFTKEKAESREKKIRVNLSPGHLSVS